MRCSESDSSTSMPGMTPPSLDIAAGDAAVVSFAGDADAHASAEPMSTTVAAVATTGEARRRVEIVIWVK
jgi:hypothetical protein